MFVSVEEPTNHIESVTTERLPALPLQHSIRVVERIYGPPGSLAGNLSDCCVVYRSANALSSYGTWQRGENVWVPSDGHRSLPYARLRCISGAAGVARGGRRRERHEPTSSVSQPQLSGQSILLMPRSTWASRYSPSTGLGRRWRPTSGLPPSTPSTSTPGMARAMRSEHWGAPLRPRLQSARRRNWVGSRSGTGGTPELAPGARRRLRSGGG